MTQQSSPLNSDLINKLSTMFYNNNKEEKYYFDDFENDKRKNRMFTQKQKELCWKNVKELISFYILIIIHKLYN